MASSFLSKCLPLYTNKHVGRHDASPREPGSLKSIAYILYRLHTAKPLGVEHELPQTLLEDLTARLKFALHVSQRTARILGTLLLRACVKHPLGWSIPQEVVCMLMYGILQSRQVPAWRAFFSGVGDLQHWLPTVKEQVTTGSCVSWWVRLAPDRRPQDPHTSINWLYLHGGAFVAGDALMYTGVFTSWLMYLAEQGIDCSILSVEYPLAPEHPFPAGVNAAADALHWLLHDSGETADYFVGGDSAGGNLAVAGLSLLRDSGQLSRAPLGLTLISPAVDMSNTSVFGSREPVSSHFDQHPAHAHSSSHAEDAARRNSSSSSGGSSSNDGADGAGSMLDEGLLPGSGLDSSSSSSSNGTSSHEHGGSSGPIQTHPVQDSTGSAGSTGSAQQGVSDTAVTPSPEAPTLLTGSSFRQRRGTRQDIALPNPPQQQQQQQQQQQRAPVLQHLQPLQPQGSMNVAKLQLEKQQVPLQSQPSVDCSIHSAHTAGGRLRPWHLVKDLLGDAVTALKVLSSRSGAQAVAASGWFDYIPSDSFSDELHCYLADPKLLTHPLVSPTYLKDFSGLCQVGMLVLAGGAELMRPDIQAFAAKVAAAVGGGDSAAAAAGAELVVKPAAELAGDALAVKPPAAAAAAAPGDRSAAKAAAAAAGPGASAGARPAAMRAGEAPAAAPAAPGAAAAAAALHGRESTQSADSDADAASDVDSTAAAGADGQQQPEQQHAPAAADPSVAATGPPPAAAAAAGGAGYAVLYHEEPCEPHAYAMLSLPHLMQKGLVVPRFVAAVVKGGGLEAAVWPHSKADAST